MRLTLRGSSRRLGFTLIELMVVLVLIGIMTALIIPEMKGTYEEALLRSTARKLVSVFNLANSRAIALHQLHHVRLDRKDGRYSVERTVQERGRGLIPLRGVPGGEGGIDTRISIEIRKPGEDPADAPGPEAPFASRDDLPGRNSEETVAFYPDGTADAVEILLRDRDGFRLALRINPTTARVDIVELERE